MLPCLSLDDTGKLVDVVWVQDSLKCRILEPSWAKPFDQRIVQGISTSDLDRV